MVYIPEPKALRNPPVVKHSVEELLRAELARKDEEIKASNELVEAYKSEAEFQTEYCRFVRRISGLHEVLRLKTNNSEGAAVWNEYMRFSNSERGYQVKRGKAHARLAALRNA